MGDFFAALIALLVGLLILPIILLIVLFALVLAGIGTALGLALALLGIFFHLLWAALPFLLIVGVLYLIFRPARSREVVRQ
jgi:hypothetical protein